MNQPVAQPAFSQIRVETGDDRITVEVPPRGIWAAAGRMFLVGIAWCVTMATFTAVLSQREPLGRFAWVIVAGMWLPGILMLLVAIHAGRRRTEIHAEGDSVTVLDASPVSQTEYFWNRDELADVSIGPSGMTIGDRHVLELKLQLLDGWTLGLLSGRDADELSWLAELLRQTMRRQQQEHSEEQTE